MSSISHFCLMTSIYFVIFSVLICHLTALVAQKDFGDYDFLGLKQHLCKDLMTIQRQFEHC